MGLDIAALIIIGLFFIRGYMKGLIVAAFSVVAILLGLVVALKFSQSLAEWLRIHDYVSSAWVQVVSYIALFIGVVLLVRMVARAIEGAVEGMMLGTLNKLAGGILYALLGAILWSSLLWIGDAAKIIPEEKIAASTSYPWFKALAPWIWEQAGHLLPFVKDTFAKLQSFFDSVNNKPDVGTH
jgi:membrane protein required for colicin V production